MTERRAHAITAAGARRHALLSWFQLRISCQLDTMGLTTRAAWQRLAAERRGTACVPEPHLVLVSASHSAALTACSCCRIILADLIYEPPQALMACCHVRACTPDRFMACGRSLLCWRCKEILWGSLAGQVLSPIIGAVLVFRASPRLMLGSVRPSGHLRGFQFCALYNRPDCCAFVSA